MKGVLTSKFCIQSKPVKVRFLGVYRRAEYGRSVDCDRMTRGTLEWEERGRLSE